MDLFLYVDSTYENHFTSKSSLAYEIFVDGFYALLSYWIGLHENSSQKYFKKQNLTYFFNFLIKGFLGSFSNSKYFVTLFTHFGLGSFILQDKFHKTIIFQCEKVN